MQDWFYVAGVYAAMSEKDQAFDWLYRAVQHHDFFLTEMAAHPYMDPLRADPRFAKLVKELRFPPSSLMRN